MHIGQKTRVCVLRSMTEFELTVVDDNMMALAPMKGARYPCRRILIVRKNARVAKTPECSPSKLFYARPFVLMYSTAMHPLLSHLSLAASSAGASSQSRWASRSCNKLYSACWYEMDCNSIGNITNFTGNGTRVHLSPRLDKHHLSLPVSMEH